jgi:predicted double-glycine peptidase
MKMFRNGLLGYLRSLMISVFAWPLRKDGSFHKYFYTTMETFKEYFEGKLMEKVAKSHIYINLPSSRQQTDYTCGAVALRSIAKYFGRNLKDEKAFADLCDSGKNKGAHPEDIAKAARLLGFDATVKENMTVEELTNYISKKIPVICAIQAWSNEADPQKALKGYKNLRDGHYVVAIGFDDKNIYFEDPSIKGSRPYLSKEEFLKRWIDKEAYVNNPVKKRLGIIIKGNKPKRKEIITRTQRLP